HFSRVPLNQVVAELALKCPGLRLTGRIASLASPAVFSFLDHFERLRAEIFPELAVERYVFARVQAFQQQLLKPRLALFLLRLAQQRAEVFADIAEAPGGHLPIDEVSQRLGQGNSDVGHADSLSYCRASEIPKHDLRRERPFAVLACFGGIAVAPIGSVAGKWCGSVKPTWPTPMSGMPGYWKNRLWPGCGLPLARVGFEPAPEGGDPNAAFRSPMSLRRPGGGRYCPGRRTFRSSAQSRPPAVSSTPA